MFLFQVFILYITSYNKFGIFSQFTFPAPFSKVLVTLTEDEDNIQGYHYEIWLKIYLKVVFLWHLPQQNVPCYL